MATKKDNNTRVVQVDFKQALSERYLSYALSTIMSRSLPDVRDGLKPVHRRLIYAMEQLKLNPNSGFKKCARVVGDVMGKFHPHGDAAIYNAMVRLAQDFSVRYPLVDGQGNFGNIDGDNPAAMRYTEARLTEASLFLLEGIEENAVDFRPTYDGEEKEPLVLPASFPNVLANGATGIAVGMATSIPPHNLDELCEGMVHLIDNPEMNTEEIMAFIPGPDFPTGGIITEKKETLHKIYESGKGSIRTRALWHQEDKKGGQYQVVITQIPYMVEKSKLIEKIATLIHEKKLPLVDDVIDESTEEVRIVIQPKSRNVDPLILMESLFRQTDLESRFHVNLNVLDSLGTPRVMGIIEILKEFLAHRKIVNVRRSAHRLERIIQRLEILEGYLIVYLNLDEVIAIIREHDNPKEELCRRFKLTENQAEHILNMRLRSLRKLQEIEIRKEREDLLSEKDTLEKFLGSESLQNKRIQKDLREIQKKFGKSTPEGARRSFIMDPPEGVVIPLDMEIEKEDVTLVLSEKNWIRTIKGHNAPEVKYKEGDGERYILNANTQDKLLLMSSGGRCFTLGIDKLPKGKNIVGEALRILIDLPPEDEIINISIVRPGDEEKKYLVVSSDARGFQVKVGDLMAQTKVGKIVMNPNDKEGVSHFIEVKGDHVAIIGNNRKMVVFPVSEIPLMSRGKGVTLQKYKEAKISDLQIFLWEEGLFFRRSGQIRRVENVKIWLGKRAAIGRLAPIGFPIDNKFGI